MPTSVYTYPSSGPFNYKHLKQKLLGRLCSSRPGPHSFTLFSLPLTVFQTKWPSSSSHVPSNPSPCRCAGHSHCLASSSPALYMPALPPSLPHTPSALCPSTWLFVRIYCHWGQGPHSYRGVEVTEVWKEAQGFLSSSHLHITHGVQFGAHRSNRKFTYYIWQTTRNECGGVFCSQLTTIFCF